MDWIEKELREQAEDAYCAFNRKIAATDRPMYGVRMPVLRQMAKRILCEDPLLFLNQEPEEDYERMMLKAMVIGLYKGPLDEKFDLIRAYVSKMDNWAFCDCFCSGLKALRPYRDELWAFMSPYMASEREYDQRFVAVMLLNHYMEEEWIDRVLECVDRLGHSGYYADMGIAWCLSYCYIQFPEKTKAYFADNNQPVFVQNMAIQKIRDSRRVSQEDKDGLLIYMR